MNIREQFYWEEKESAEENEIKKKFVFPVAWKTLERIKNLVS